MKTVLGQITDELGELGKKIVKETAKAPVSIATGVFEKKQSETREKTPFDMLEKAKTPKEKRGMARNVLQELQQLKKTKEPRVYEKKMMEEGQKREKKQQQAKTAAWQSLPKTGSHARRGDLKNLAKKQAGTETGKNIVNQ